MNTTHLASAAQDIDEATEDGPEYFASYTEVPGWEDVDVYADCSEEEMAGLEVWLRTGRWPA